MSGLTIAVVAAGLREGLCLKRGHLFERQQLILRCCDHVDMTVPRGWIMRLLTIGTGLFGDGSTVIGWQ